MNQAASNINLRHRKLSSTTRSRPKPRVTSQNNSFKLIKVPKDHSYLDLLKQQTGPLFFDFPVYPPEKPKADKNEKNEKKQDK